MISVTILTKNNQRTLPQVLEALKRFEEVLIYDTGSLDKTLEIAKSFPNVSLYQGEFQGFGNTHNVASSLAKFDWILSIDSDEIATLELVEEIHNLLLDPGSVYSFWRKNFYRGKWIRWCGWYPDRVIRLYQRKRTKFSDCFVHERVISEGMKKISLSSQVLHEPYLGPEDFLSKMQSYSNLFAEQNRGKKKSSFSKALGHGAYTFFKSYFLKRGILGGREGFEISFYNAASAYYKYLKLDEANRSKGPPSDREFCQK